MKPVTIERAVWVLIYGGAVTSMLGLWALDGDAELGWTLIGAGSVAVVLGVAAIAWRARIGRRARADAAR